VNRSIVLRLAAGGIAALLAVTAASAETVRVGKAGRDAFPFVPADVGQRLGLFKKHDIDLEISHFGGEARVQQAMVADGIDIGLGSGPGLAFIAKGSPVKGIAALADPPLTFALVVRNDDSVKSLDDLKGKKVAVSTVGSVTGWIVGELSRQKGWGYDGMAQTPIGDDTTRVASLKTKAVDGAVVNLAVALNFVQRGDGKILLRFGDLIKDFHVHVIFATDKAIATKPDTLRRFMAGWLDTVAFMRKDKAKTVEIAKDVMGTDEKSTSDMYDGMIAMFNDTGRFNPKALAVLSRSYVDMKVLNEEPDMQKVINEAFLPRN
jgi:NitT/TauT family transport system substrate-binding protein